MSALLNCEKNISIIFLYKNNMQKKIYKLKLKLLNAYKIKLK